MTYSAEGILLKNKDPVSEDLTVLMKQSDEPAVRSLFAASKDTMLLDRKKGAKFQVCDGKLSVKI